MSERVSTREDHSPDEREKSATPEISARTPSKIESARQKTRDSLPDPPEASVDGCKVRIPFEGSGRPEFGPSTEVLYVNGINTPLREEIRNARDYASIIHSDVLAVHVATNGIGRDLEASLAEKNPFGKIDPPIASVADAVLAHVQGGRFEGDVHIAAHSRGALIVERAMEVVATTLQSRGWSIPEIRERVFEHVSIETFGGAATALPDGVRTVAYVNTHDGVAAAFGVMPVTAHTQGSINELASVTSALGSGAELATALVAESYQLQRTLRVREDGPTILYEGAPAINPVQDLLAAHAISGPNGYLSHRRPFEQTYDLWLSEEIEKRRLEPVPRPVPGSTPVVLSHAEDLNDGTYHRALSRPGPNRADDAATPTLSQFHRGKQDAYTGETITGFVSNVGPFIAVKSVDRAGDAVTLIPRSELLSLLEARDRSRLSAALRDGNAVEIVEKNGRMSVTPLQDAIPLQRQNREHSVQIEL